MGGTAMIHCQGQAICHHKQNWVLGSIGIKGRVLWDSYQHLFQPSAVTRVLLSMWSSAVLKHKDTGSNALQKWPQPQMPVPIFLLLLRQLLLQEGGWHWWVFSMSDSPCPHRQVHPGTHHSDLWRFGFCLCSPQEWAQSLVHNVHLEAYENCRADLHAVGGAGQNTRRDLHYYRRGVQLSEKKGLFWNQLLYNVDHKSLLGR